MTPDGGWQLGESSVELQRLWWGADGCFMRRRKQVRLCLGAERIKAGWRRRSGRHTWPTSVTELGLPAHAEQLWCTHEASDRKPFKRRLRLTSGPRHFFDLLIF
jgi:hypothetical protein